MALNSTFVGSTGNPTEDKPLPEGWEMLIDKTTGWPFFVDHINQSTSWQDPRTSVQPSYANAKPTVREIPIQRQSPLQGRDSPHRGSPARDIPIIRESRDVGTPPRQQAYPPSNPMYATNERSNQWSANTQPHGYTSMPQPSWQPETLPARTQPSWQSETQPARTQPSWQPETQPVKTQPSWQADTQPSRPPAHAPSWQSPPVTLNQPMPQPPQPEKGAYWDIPIKLNSQNHKPASSGATVPPNNESKPSAAEPLSGSLAPPPGEDSSERGRSPSPKPMSTMEQLEQIYAEAESLEHKVNVFSGRKKDKEYMYMEEMLTRLIIKLDNIDSEGKDEIRSIRRKAVKTVQATLDHLELKAMAQEQKPISSQASDRQSDLQSAKSHMSC